MVLPGAEADVLAFVAPTPERAPTSASANLCSLAQERSRVGSTEQTCSISTAPCHDGMCNALRAELLCILQGRTVEAGLGDAIARWGAVQAQSGLPELAREVGCGPPDRRKGKRRPRRKHGADEEATAEPDSPEEHAADGDAIAGPDVTGLDGHMGLRRGFLLGGAGTQIAMEQPDGVLFQAKGQPMQHKSGPGASGPKCLCDFVAARVLIKGEGPKFGEAYLSCGRPVQEDRCSFFMWEGSAAAGAVYPIQGNSVQCGSTPRVLVGGLP